MSLLLLEPPSAMPRSTLVAWWDFYFPNILVESETWDTSPWAATNVTVADEAEAPPVAGMLVHSLTATADAGTVLQTATMLANATMHMGVWLKRKTGTGDIKIQTKAGTLTTVAVTDDWQFLAPATLAIGATNEANACGLVIATDTDAVYVGGAQLYPGELPDYVSTTTLQTIADLTGHGYTLTRGANSTADAADPSVVGPGLYFTTNDYTLDIVLPVCLNGPLTVVWVQRSANYALSQTPVSFTHTADAKWVQIFAGKAEVYSAALGDLLSTALSRTNDYGYVFSLSKVAAGVGTTTRLDSMISASTAVGDIASPGTTSRFCIGAQAGAKGGYLTGIVYEAAVYGAVLSPSDLKRAYRKLLNKWTGRGVGLPFEAAPVGAYTLGDEAVISVEETGRYKSFPTAVACDDGSILCCYRDGTSHISNGDIKLIRNTNGVWGDPWIVYTKVSATDQWQYGGLVKGPTGRLFLYSRKYIDPEPPASDNENYYAYSDDHGATWSAQTLIPSPLDGFETGYGVAFAEHACKFVTLGDGKLLVTAIGMRPGDTDHYSAAVMQSTDGITWTHRAWVGGGDTINSDLVEATAIRTDNGRILCAARRDDASIYQSYSDDDGTTWSSPVLAPGTDQGGGGGDGGGAPVLWLHPDGALFLTYRGSDATLKLRVSVNHGASWGEPVTINTYVPNIGNGGYSDMALDEAGRLHIIYYTDDEDVQPWLQERVVSLA